MLTIHWFRRDLRLQDNAAFYHALKNEKNVLPLFIFDKNILGDLTNRADARVTFLHDTVIALKAKLEEKGSSLLIKYGKPEEVFAALFEEFAAEFSGQTPIKAVYTNHDYEPYALARDAEIAAFLASKKTAFYSFKDHVIFEKNEVVKDDGKPYTVFTPYSRKWKAKLNDFYLKPYPTEKYFENLHQIALKPAAISLASMGFERSTVEVPDKTVAQNIIKNYTENRNFPAINGTSRLGLHFRFGTISIREKARKAQGLNETFLNELIWRDFYSVILHHFPHVVTEPFAAKYKGIAWRDAPDELKRWQEGKTGYPLVDAGMRELNATGFMHNRVRMVVASFLTKHLLIDWRLGEAYFAEKLLDFDLASNNGGWQWAAGCGTDAAPYFRVFNPTAQQEKFDKQFIYIKKWIPEYGTPKYPEPMVEHSFARNRCLETYKKGLENILN